MDDILGEIKRNFVYNENTNVLSKKKNSIKSSINGTIIGNQDNIRNDNYKNGGSKRVSFQSNVTPIRNSLPGSLKSNRKSIISSNYPFNGQSRNNSLIYNDETQFCKPLFPDMLDDRLQKDKYNQEYNRLPNTEFRGNQECIENDNIPYRLNLATRITPLLSNNGQTYPDTEGRLQFPQTNPDYGVYPNDSRIPTRVYNDGCDSDASYVDLISTANESDTFGIADGHFGIALAAFLINPVIGLLAIITAG